MQTLDDLLAEIDSRVAAATPQLLQQALTILEESTEIKEVDSKNPLLDSAIASYRIIHRIYRDLKLFNHRRRRLEKPIAYEILAKTKDGLMKAYCRVADIDPSITYRQLNLLVTTPTL